LFVDQMKNTVYYIKQETMELEKLKNRWVEISMIEGTQSENIKKLNAQIVSQTQHIAELRREYDSWRKRWEALDDLTKAFDPDPEKRTGKYRQIVKDTIKTIEEYIIELKNAEKGVNNLSDSTQKLIGTTKEVSKAMEVLSEKMADYFRTPIEKLAFQREEMLKIAKDNAELRVQIEEWYIQETLKIVQKELKEKVKADKERTKEHKRH